MIVGSTIHNLAESARRRGIECMGEAAFARLCLHFDSLVSADDGTTERYIKVLQLMVAGDNATAMQLGFCWLDASGYGQKDTWWLHYELVKVAAL